MRETQATISEWAEATFGPPGNTLRMAARVHEEVSELLRSVSGDGTLAEIADEATDSMIVLARLGWRVGADCYISNAPAIPERAPRAQLQEVAGHVARGIGGVIHAIATGQSDVRKRIENLWEELTTLLQLAGRQPQAAIDAKMAINRNRQWNLDGTGHGYHAPEGAAP